MRPIVFEVLLVKMISHANDTNKTIVLGFSNLVVNLLDYFEFKTHSATSLGNIVA